MNVQHNFYNSTVAFLLLLLWYVKALPVKEDLMKTRSSRISPLVEEIELDQKLIELETSPLTIVSLMEKQSVANKSESSYHENNNTNTTAMKFKSDKNTGNRRFNRPKTVHGIQNMKTQPNPSSNEGLDLGQAVQSEFPNHFESLESFPFLVIPSLSWTSFTKIFQGLFNAPTSPRIKSNGTYPILRLDGIGNDCEEKMEIYAADDAENTLLCKSDSRSSSSCSGFCVRNGFVQGECNNENYCVCQLIDEEKKIGLVFKYYKDDITSLFNPIEDGVLGKCQKCHCSSNCQKFGHYIGYCGNTCYCGNPWHDESF